MEQDFLGKQMKSTGIFPVEPRQSEEWFRRIAENSRDMIYRISLPDGEYEYVNQAVIEMTGYSPEELYKDHLIFRKTIHPDWQKYFLQKWDNLVQGNATPFYEYKIIHKSGTERWFHQRNILIFNNNGHHVAIGGMVNDITERKQTEEKLREYELKYDALLNNATEMVLIADTQGNLLEANKRAESFLGYTSDELSGMHLKQIHPEEELEKYKNALAEMVKGKSAIGSDIRVIKKDGTLVPVDITVTVIKCKERTIIQGIFRNPTERERTREEWDELVHELREAFVKIKTLSGILPICASCMRIRDEKGCWKQIEAYIRDHSEAEFSHGICPECVQKLYPEYYKKK